MENWNERYNWTYEDYRSFIRDSFTLKGHEHASMDVEHSSASNIKNLIRWAKEDGYEAEEDESLEVVRVRRKEK